MVLKGEVFLLQCKIGAYLDRGNHTKKPSPVPQDNYILIPLCIYIAVQCSMPMFQAKIFYCISYTLSDT